MASTEPSTTPLRQQAQLQTQANRYQFLRRVADAKLITQIANK